MHYMRLLSFWASVADLDTAVHVQLHTTLEGVRLLVKVLTGLN